MSGILYIVATPIGNLQDISLRAIEVLKSVNWIAAEDTRHSGVLLQHFGIKTPTLSLHDYNERERANKLFEYLQDGASIALISDAGTPLISDPGYYLVREARGLGVQVVPIPGACAAIAALSVAGLPTDKFIFEGFLPAKMTAKKNRIQALSREERTLVFYESPRRVLETLETLQLIVGEDRIVVIARELTKMFETIYSGSLNSAVEWVANDVNQQRGEIVIVLAGATPLAQSETHDIERILAILLADLPLKQAVDLAVKLTGQKKNILYSQALIIREQQKSSQALGDE